MNMQKAIGLLLKVMSIFPSLENDSTRPLASQVMDMSQQGMAKMTAPIIFHPSKYVYNLDMSIGFCIWVLGSEQEAMKGIWRQIYNIGQNIYWCCRILDNEISQ